MQIKFLSVGCGDAISIRFLDDIGQYRNILIDGGIGKMYNGILRAEIEGIINRKENIDLWIISHIDDDHIGGVLQFIQDRTLCNQLDWSKTQFWFNATNADYLVNLKETNLKSVNQGKKLRDFLKSQSIVNEQITTLSDPIIFHGAKLTILSPNQAAYDRLLKHWQTKGIVQIPTNTKVGAKANDYKIKLEDFDASNFQEDTAIPNGSSIAFLLEYQSKKIIFTADSFPSILIETLTKLGYSSNNKLNVDLMQVAHHGSKANNSLDLLQIIDCQDFIISGDAINKHNLPNKEALARYIVAYKNSKIKFHFTHKNNQTKSIFAVDKNIQNVDFVFPEQNNALIFNF